MSAIPPVCHVPPVTPTTQPGPVGLPAIPPASSSISSLVQTVNALRQNMLIITGRQGSQGRQGVPGPQGQPGKNAKEAWKESSRAEETVKIYQNNDPSTGNFVEVKQINRLTMSNKDTGQSWTWNR